MTSILKVDEIQNTDGKTGIVITPDGSLESVKFPEQSNPSGRVITSTTMSSYEEGYYQTTFTPSTSGSITLSGSHRYLRYTKVNRTVYIYGKVDAVSVSNPKGFIHVSLPFPIDNESPAGLNDSRRFTGSVWVARASIGMTQFILYGIEGEGGVRLYRADTDINQPTSAELFGGNESIALSFFYHANE